MNFVGRSSHLVSLGERFARISSTGAGQMIAVRGRRQVGKSRLYTEFIARENVRHVFFTAIKGAANDAQLASFQNETLTALPSIFNASTLFASRPTSWSDALGRVRLAAEQGPVVVVLDEFPWAAESDPSLEGALQVEWDRHLQHLPVLLILIGSDIHMMERLTMHDRALFGRATEEVVKPFNPAEIAEAAPGTTPVGVFDALLITGGYPRLLADLRLNGDPLAYVRSALQEENSTLVNSAQRSLDAEFPSETQARWMLSAIGAEPVGHATFSSVVGRLAQDSGQASTALTRALKALRVDKGVLAIDTPAGSDANSKLRRYRIDDPYLRFWFRFVEPQLANVARGRPDLAVSAFDRGWDAWRGRAIEPVVHDALNRLAPTVPALVATATMSSWWTRDNAVEIDVVASDRKGEVLAIGSVKWRERRQFDSSDLAALQVARTRMPGAATAELLTVCPAGTQANIDPDLTFDAERLLSAWHA